MQLLIDESGWPKMCGIAGLFDTKGLRSYNPATIRRMTDAIAHRGPDGEGLHLEPGVGLGHRRLAIVDVAGGAQPMRTQDGSLTVVFNGEIYNFPELRRQLKEQGAVFRTRSDTEVLLHGWRHWGEAMLPRLRGMFAFALWDARDRTLLLARDPFGKKPLHYVELPDGTLAFASEIKALLRLAETPRDLDPTAVEDFFTYGYVPEPKSIYRAIRKLPAAHRLVVRTGHARRVMRYWSLLDDVSRPAEATEEDLRERLGAAVTSRLISDVPLGALLSGGVDSSAVVALMAGRVSGPVKTFSIGFAEAGHDESAFAARVADRYATTHETRQVGADDVDLLRRLPEIYDEPFGDVSAVPTFAVCREARRSVTVALTGDGGDEVLAGYRRYAFHLAGECVRAHIPAGVRDRVFGPLSQAYPHGAWLPRSLRAKATLRELSLDSADAYVRMVSALPKAVRAVLTTRDFRQSLDGYDASGVMRAAFNVDAPLDPLQRAQYADLTTYLPGDILTKLDRSSMANSLELRSPMLDLEFSAWSFRLPRDRKLSGVAGGKAILKRAMEPHLPKDLLYRPKQGFDAPVSRWFRGPLKGDLQALAHAPELRGSGVVDTATLLEMTRCHASSERDHSKALWLAWIFQSFLAHRPPPGVQMA